jgi:hypothetical protein
MRRDMDLIRKMLLAVEDGPHGYAPRNLRISGYTDEQVGYHAYLVIDAGLATGPTMTSSDSESPESQIRVLTWAGHEFIAAARNDTVWRKVTARVASLAGDVPFTVWKDLLTLSLRSLFPDDQEINV